MSLGTQLWIGRIQPAGSLFNAARNDREYINKPRGGLWTSTWDDEQGSAWVQWCLGEDWGVPPGRRWTCWHIKPTLPHVYTIDSYDDLARLYALGYGRQNRPRDGDWPTLHGAPPLDFERLGEEYDAIHLTEEGQWKTRLTHPYTLYGWDCECTLWLRWKFTVTYAGIREFSYGDVEPDPPIRKARKLDF